MRRFLPFVAAVLFACTSGSTDSHGEPHAAVDDHAADTHAAAPSAGDHHADPSHASGDTPADHHDAADATGRPALPHEVDGASLSFLPDVAVDAHKTPSAALRPPGAPISRAATPPVVAGTPAPQVVVVPRGSFLDGLDLNSPLTTVRRIAWRVVLGMLILLGVHTLIARARRRLPKLQDDLLLLQLGSVVTVLGLTALAVVRALEQSSPLMAGASLVAVGLVAVWFGVRFLPRYIEGLYLVLGPTVRIGDWVALESDSGILAEVGLVRLTLVREDGRRFSIPVASLGGARFSVQPRDHSAPVDVVLALDGDAERLRRKLLAAAHVSPYRDPDTPVSAVVNGDSLRVHFVAWSPDVVEHAVRHLRRAYTRIAAA